jgi:hypothetical protein
MSYELRVNSYEFRNVDYKVFQLAITRLDSIFIYL